ATKLAVVLVVYWQITAKKWSLLVSHKQRATFYLNGFGRWNHHGRKWDKTVVSNDDLLQRETRIRSHEPTATGMEEPAQKQMTDSNPA
ncbi:hypothetical protein GOODEAATRI_011699, partial [Goodea atripinnis]